MRPVAELLEEDARARLSAEPFPDPSPMLATLSHDHFDDPDWIYERKLDGQRILLGVRDGRAKLRSRRGERLDATYPELIEAAEAAALPDLVADGEVVAFDPVPGTGVHHVEPALVAEVTFFEWTRDGRLRHPSFVGLRNDKDPREVVREG